jgi:hypothetical protein
MTNPAKQSTSIVLLVQRVTVSAVTILGLLTSVTLQAARAQGYTILHNFSGGTDEQGPLAGLTSDGNGNFYGTTFGHRFQDGSGYGTVFKPTKHNGGWTFATANYQGSSSIPIVRHRPQNAKGDDDQSNDPFEARQGKRSITAHDWQGNKRARRVSRSIR